MKKVKWMMIVFILAIVLALPVSVAMGLASAIPGWIDPAFKGNAKFILLAITGGMNSTPMLAIPLFVFAGSLMTHGGIARNLFNVFAYFFGKLPAGYPCAVIITCLFYGALSGSAPATAAAVGTMTIPLMMELGYRKDYAGAICTAAGSLGVIIPPSIPMVLFGLFTGASIGDMFIGGILPGILVALCMIAYAVYHALRHGEDKETIYAHYEELHRRGFWNVLKDGVWALLMPVIILGGIYGGLVTPTEAACVSVVYAAFVSVVIYKAVKIKDLWSIAKEAVITYCPIIFTIGVANAFSRVLTLLNVSNAFVDFLTANIPSKYVFLLIFNILLLFIGMFADVGAVIMILAPLMVPVAKLYGINLIHMGIIMIVNASIGYVTPPFGVNLFIMSPLLKMPVMTLGKQTWPYVGAFILALLLITYCPFLTLAFL